MAIPEMFHVIYVPTLGGLTKTKLRGNGGNFGSPGHRTHALGGPRSLNGTGCMVNGKVKWADCFSCPFPPETCHFSPSQCYSKKKRKGRS